MTETLSITPTKVTVGDFSTEKRYLRAKSPGPNSFPVPKGITLYMENDSNNYTSFRYSQGVGRYAVTYTRSGASDVTGDPDISLVYPDE